MGCDAPVPVNTGETRENYGFSVLDLVKHAARTILETMDDGDRLGIVVFASAAKVVQKLLPMNKKNKVLAEKNIASMEPEDTTNLWHGLLEGIKLFKQDDEAKKARVPAMMVLTDGMPNHMCPVQGYVPKLRSMGQLPASIHTFGFGYDLRSGLLKSLAEISSGNYAFIPDASMIGTVFVHALANLQATYATNATLRLTYSSLSNLEDMINGSVDQQEPATLPDEDEELKQLSISLGNLQYGQSRDIVLRVKAPKGLSPKRSNIKASLHYSLMTSKVYSQTAERSLENPTSLPESELAYSLSRAQLCSFLSSIMPILDDGERETKSYISLAKVDEFRSLVKALPANNFPSDPRCKSLLEDLIGEPPKGQVSLGLTNLELYHRWGAHYLPSLLNAHARQVCNAFKDPGPLLYGADSPLFVACRDRLNAAFDNLPAPKPSNYHPEMHLRGVNMSSYNSSAGVCFAASTPVRLASGRTVPIRTVQRGTALSTPSGPRRVVAVLKTLVRGETLCCVGALVVTPWHPLSLNDGKTWTFPADVADRQVRYTGFIYSILLQSDRDPAAHAVSVAGVWGVTLGHGIVAGYDTRAHQFFGNYSRVTAELRNLGIGRKGIAVGKGVSRESTTGLVRGFKPYGK
ncbi:U-box domain-containing protein [Colletotrichum tofieldiae]|nr:U-box domain-containing protein [Colletotrichum tofieldiae]GKT68251.1 U-box domain-containing protein [Colletotrichum tofieldiae]